MADDENEVPVTEKETLSALTSVEDWTADREDPSRVTAVAFVSALCQHTDAAKATMRELSAASENAGTVFKLCSVDDCPDVARAASISALPAFFFVAAGTVLEHFCGNNMEKLRVCAKAADLKRKELLAKLEKEREEAARIAAEQAAEKAAAEAAAAAPPVAEVAPETA
jgi:thioredoxin-like negative regulator of GroEL